MYTVYEHCIFQSVIVYLLLMLCLQYLKLGILPQQMDTA